MLNKAVAEKRRYRRYELYLPVEILRVGEQPVLIRLKSRNISCRGILLEDPEAVLHKGQLIEFVVHLPSAEEGVEVHLHCKGGVVRRDRARNCAAAVLQRYEFERVLVRAASAGR